MSTEVPDGATQRHSRMMELLTFINLTEPHGATITQIQSHMLTVFGLKFRTTSEMVRELTMSGTIKVDGHGFYHLTEKQQAAMKTLIAQEKADNAVGSLIRRIDKVKDDKARLSLKSWLRNSMRFCLKQSLSQQKSSSEVCVCLCVYFLSLLLSLL